VIVAGQILADRFELQRRIGSGGMGEVFAAFDRTQGEMVALKTLMRADGDTLSRFKREFRALQTTAHPNLVSLRELIRDGEHWFFTMELVEGKHFLDYVRGAGAADHHRLRAVLRQLVGGLLALHDGGLVHRDIKPSNVMVTPEGRVVILDFGLITHMDPAGQSSATGPVGTVEYMAPEQAVGRGVGEAADWYSVGVMLYEALTGAVPHGGHALQILIDKQQVEPPPVDELAPDAPADLRALCGRHAVHLQAVGDVFLHVHVGKQRIGLEHHADVATLDGQRGHVLVVEEYAPAGIGRFQPRDHPQQRGLAAARGPEEHDGLAALHFQRGALQGAGAVGKGLGAIDQADRRAGPGRAHACPAFLMRCIP